MSESLVQTIKRIGLQTTNISGQVPLNWLGLQNYGVRNLPINFNFPTAALWLIGLSCVRHLYR